MKLKAILFSVIMVFISISIYAEDKSITLINNPSSDDWVIRLLEPTNDPSVPTSIMFISSLSMVTNEDDNIHIAYNWALGATTWEAAKKLTGRWGIRYATFKNGNLLKEDVSGDFSVFPISLTVDKNIPYISYMGIIERNIYICKKTDTSWISQILDVYGWFTDTEIFSIAADKNHRVHVLYCKGEWSIGRILMYAIWSSEGVIKEELGRINKSNNILEPYNDSLAIDNNDQVHIAGGNSKLQYAKKTNNTWQTTNIETSDILLKNCKIAVDKNNYPHITYINYNTKTGLYQLKYARFDKSNWIITKILDLPNDIQWSPSPLSLSFKFSSDDYINIVISYIYGNYERVTKYIKFKDTQGIVEDIDVEGSNISLSSSINLGQASSIVLNKKDIPYITYSKLAGGLFYAAKIKKIAESREDKLIPVNNYFNASSDKATIIYKLSQQGLARIRIYTINGELIRTLVEEDKVEGTYTVEWDGKDEFGGNVGSGLYFVVFEAPGVKEVKKICVVK